MRIRRRASLVSLVTVAMLLGGAWAVFAIAEGRTRIVAGSPPPSESSTAAPTDYFWPAPERSVDSPLTGDISSLEAVRYSPQAWNQVSGSVSLNGQAIDFMASKSGAWAVEVGDAKYQMTDDGLRVEIEPQRKLARVRWRNQPAASSVAETNETTDDPAASPLPGENPTNNDIVNMVITPSYWLRNTVERHATEVKLVGEEVIAGREAHRVQIRFASPAGAKYATEGWTWWIDAERGTLLKWVIPFAAEADTPPQVVEATRIDFDHGERAVTIPEIPAGFEVETLIDGDDGRPRAQTVVLELATSAAALVEQLRGASSSTVAP